LTKKNNFYILFFIEENIHNDFFISIIKNRDNARDFLSGALPENIASKIDFNYLDYDDTSYIQNRFKDLFSDIVIKTKINNRNADIFILVEHKSTLPEANALFRPRNTSKLASRMKAGKSFPLGTKYTRNSLRVYFIFTDFILRILYV